MAGEYGKAIARLETLRKHGSSTQAARASLLEAQAYRLSLRPERAVPILESVAKSQGPEAEQGELLLAQTLQRDLSLPRRAAEVYADAQRRFPQGIFREEIAYRLGEVLLSAGEPREGVAALERYLSQFPTASHADDAHLSIAAARRDRLNDCAGAIPHLKAVAGAGPLKTPRAELALIGEARCLQTMGRTVEARAAYTRYLDERPRGRFADEARQASSTSHR
jgi:tetratricopeptide (TPR) repeat protein